MLARNFARNRSGNFLAKTVASLAFILLAALASRLSLAQGLGELTLESGLNEPFRASVELLNVAGLDPNQVSIRLATPDEYEQAGIDYQSLVSRIRFETTIPASGNGVLRLSSEDRITEPFLSLLVSARWPAGRVMREYTVLLDLPGRGAAPAAASLPSSQSPAAPAAAPRTQTPAAALPAATPELTGADTYTVDSGDSLWTIAERTRPSANVPVPQMMVAIQRANEDAFVNNDINRLLSGRVLRIPDQREIANVDAGEAVAFVNAGSSGTTALGLPGASGGAGAQGDELTVLTEDDANVAAGSSDLEATIAALENALLLSEEELDRARLENAELTAQLGELQDQIAILQNIIAIEDERLASLQEELAAQAEATAAARVANQQATQSLASQAPAGGEGLVGRIMTLLGNNLIALGIGLLLVLAVVAFLVQRARQTRMDDDDDLEFDDEDDDDSDYDDEAEADDETDDSATVADRYFDDEAALAPAAYGLDEESATAEDTAASGAADDDDDGYAFQTEGDDDDTPQTWLADDNDGDVDDDAEDHDVLDIEELDDDAQTYAAVSADADTGDTGAPTADAGDDIESFEFRLDTSAGPEPEPVAEPIAGNAQDVDANPDDIESLDFKFDGVEPSRVEPAVQADAVEIETVSFTPSGTTTSRSAAVESADDAETAASGTGGGLDDADIVDIADIESIDMGNFTFDENDISQEDESDEASTYTPRSNMDECDTKLDLAVAYEAMGDVDGAVEILDEVIAEGKPNQVAEAQRLKSEWQGA